jgi:hypothetical protein
MISAYYGDEITKVKEEQEEEKEKPVSVLDCNQSMTGSDLKISSFTLTF